MKREIKNGIRSSFAYQFAQSVRKCFRETKSGLRENARHRRVVKLYPKNGSKGKVLFSYIIDGFLLDSADPVPSRHTNIWQSVKMANTFVELGYEVEVISWKNHSYIPAGEYVAFVDVRRNMERIAPMLNEGCVKIVHLDTSHILFHNAAEARRLLELQERRGITLQPRRFERPNLAIEHADFATTGGNDAAVETFKYAGKPISKLPSPCATVYDWPESKDWDRSQRRFLWFSSSGLVHKGLDLVLDAFSELPDCHLTICAPINRDTDFIQAYHREMYELPNVETIGWVDIEGEQFKRIAENSSAVLHTSCSEGGAPSVKTCMHAGLIPIVSYETAVDVGEFGVTLEICTVDAIKKSVLSIASLPKGELECRSRMAWEFARRYHTRENFAKEYQKVIADMLARR